MSSLSLPRRECAATRNPCPTNFFAVLDLFLFRLSHHERL